MIEDMNARKQRSAQVKLALTGAEALVDRESLFTGLLPESRGGCRFASGLVWAFHFVSDALGEFFDLIRFLDYFEGENVLIGLVNVFLEFERQLEQPVGVGLQRSDALLGGFLLHVPRDAGMSFVFVERLINVVL